MQWSRLFIPTLRENPAEADGIGRQLLLRAGYVRQLAPGVSAYLFLAQRSLLKIESIVRAEMDRAGAQEMLLPELHPAEIARGEIRSYRQLPQVWYRIESKFLEEPGPRSTPQRVRHSIMMDAWSFDPDAAGLDVSLDKLRRSCTRIFEQCGLHPEEARSGASHQFVMPLDAGDDCILRCSKCDSAARSELASAVPSPPLAADPEGDLSPEPFHTPGRKTIAAVSEFTHLPATSQMKSLVLVAGGQPLLALLRGDHALSEPRLAAALGVGEVRAACADEIRGWFGADPGSLGPVGRIPMRIVADEALRGRRNMIAGANRDDYHLRNVTPGEDFQAEFLDLRQAGAGDCCPKCGAPVELIQALEVGCVSKLGPADSGVRVLNETGQETTVLMGSGSIAIERILSAAVEQSHDKDGISLPPSIAPFEVIVTPVNIHDVAQREAAESIYAECRRVGLDTLFDDRDERPGVKFRDADLIGVPWRITVGKKLAQGNVEVLERRSRTAHDKPVAAAAAFVHNELAAHREG